MAGQLKATGTSAPGFLGLNTQDSEVNMESGYATQALNCIIDKYGRIGSRRGWSVLTTNNGTLDDNEPITAMFEFKDVNGVITYLSAGGGKLFTGLATLTEKKVRNAADDADVPLVATADNWQIAGLSFGTGAGAEAQAFLAQKGNPLLVWNDPAGGYIFQQVGDVGAVPSGLSTSSFDPNCVLSAYGRIWTANFTQDTHTIYYSRLLEGTDFAGVGSGLLDISSVVGNNDEIVALADHNNFLIIFCKNNIIIYGNVDDPSQIALVDVITGVGCIARDSVQKTGTDLIFLSKSGLRSLTRTIQEKSMPMREISLNVRDELTNDLNNETLDNIKSVYFERDAFYLLALPSTEIIYCFDTRTVLQNGAARVTTWNYCCFKSFMSTEDRRLLLGVNGGIAEYRGYTDNGESYRIAYFTANSDLGAPNLLKFPKKLDFIVIGNEAQDFTIKYAFDYSTRFSPRTVFSSYSVVPSEWNIAEYGIGEYTGGIFVGSIRTNIGGSGRVIKVGIETSVNGAPISIQKADIYVKLGKTY
jgi:hypothetical protein